MKQVKHIHFNVDPSTLWTKKDNYYRQCEVTIYSTLSIAFCCCCNTNHVSYRWMQFKHMFVPFKQYNVNKKSISFFPPFWLCWKKCSIENILCYLINNLYPDNKKVPLSIWFYIFEWQNNDKLKQISWYKVANRNGKNWTKKKNNRFPLYANNEIEFSIIFAPKMIILTKCEPTQSTFIVECIVNQKWNVH